MSLSLKKPSRERSQKRAKAAAEELGERAAHGPLYLGES